MKRMLSLLFAAAMAASLTACGAAGGSSSASSAASSSGADPATAELFAMDTVMDLTAYGDNGQAAVDDSSAEIQRLEKLLSRTDADSQISALNNAGGAAVDTGSETAGLIGESLAYSAAVDGAFDITIAPVVSAWGFTTDSYQVPSQAELDKLLTRVDYRRVQVSGSTVTLGAGQSVDLGGIAKGYTSDRVAELFAQDGVSSGMISLGGNVYVCGSKPDGSAWRVGVQDPNNSESYVGVLALTDAFAVTSGGYQRYFVQDGKTYHHIIDPSTGYPAENGLISVTVVAGANAQEGTVSGSGTMCDAFSTSLFVMGEEKALDFWRSGKYDFGLVLVTDDGRVLVTKNISGQFTEEKDSGYSYEVVS